MASAGGAMREDSREHPRKREVRGLWGEVPGVSDRSGAGEHEGQQNGHTLKSKRGFGYGVCTAKARPSSTAVFAEGDGRREGQGRGPGRGIVQGFFMV